MERPHTPPTAYGQGYAGNLTPQLPPRYGYAPAAGYAPAPPALPLNFSAPILTPLTAGTRRRRPRRRRQRSPGCSSQEASRSTSPVEAPPPPPLSPSVKSERILTRTTSATTACLNDYEAQWIAMATTRKMSVDNAEGLLEAVRGHATKRHEGVVRWYTEKKHYGFIEAPSAAATDLFVHASEVAEPLRAGDKVSFIIGERRGRSAATKVDVLERAPPPPPRPYPELYPDAYPAAGFLPYQAPEGRAAPLPAEFLPYPAMEEVARPPLPYQPAEARAPPRAPLSYAAAGFVPYQSLEAPHGYPGEVPGPVPALA